MRASFTSLSMVVLSTVDAPVVEPEEPVEPEPVEESGTVDERGVLTVPEETAG